LAREVIATTPAPNVNRPSDYVFTTNGRGPIKGWSKYKTRLDRKMLALLKQQAEQRGDDPATVILKPWQDAVALRCCSQRVIKLSPRAYEYDPLAAKFTGVLGNDVAMADVMLVEHDAGTLRPVKPRQCALAI
jgi:hypothetical protein